ncbi:hypothetical protein CK203_019971 [Vitis vinifera]|uniref:Uncharacterized protein n=1 Tax=Vitis vinifera TaxID=29760 RepID=A0A438J2Q2_VITVI|nr:hypothetical protein CK203_019971 [Vitis vinifera]
MQFFLFMSVIGCSSTHLKFKTVRRRHTLIKVKTSVPLIATADRSKILHHEDDGPGTPRGTTQRGHPRGLIAGGSSVSGCRLPWMESICFSLSVGANMTYGKSRIIQSSHNHRSVSCGGQEHHSSLGHGE